MSSLLLMIAVGAHAAGPPESYDVSGEVANAGLSPSVATHRVTLTGRGSGSAPICDLDRWGPFYAHSCNPSGAQSDARKEAEREAREDARYKCTRQRGSVEREYDPVTACGGAYGSQDIQCRSTARVRCEVPDSPASAHGGSAPHLIGEPELGAGTQPLDALSAQD